MRRAERGDTPGASVGARNTHLVMDLARGTAHGDGGGAAELNHDLHGNPFGAQIPPPRSGISYTFKVYQVNRFTRLPERPMPTGVSRGVGSLAAMRMSALFLRTLRDDPADADVDSHRLLLRAGYIRRVSAGIYSWLPLGARVLRKVSEIVRQEMDRAGAQEIDPPDRAAARALGAHRPQRRSTATSCSGSPTARTRPTASRRRPKRWSPRSWPRSTARYRDLPVNLYQINWKYRDEIRPRFGLLRGREFLMKDAYSFDLDGDGLRESYRQMYDAYHRVFERCGLTFRPVEAQSGEMGGDVNHEFMAVAAVGEDDFVWCKACDYAANVEAARRAVAATVRSRPRPTPRRRREKVHTPDLPSIAGVSKFLGVAPNETLKCMVFDVDGELGLAVVPGDREVNEFALAAALAPKTVRLFADADFEAHPELPKGYIGPDYPGRVDRRRRPVDHRADRVGHRRERSRPPRAQRGARSRLRRRRVGRPRDDRRPATRARAAASRSRSTAASKSVTSSRSAPSTRSRSTRTTPTSTASSTRW